MRSRPTAEAPSTFTTSSEGVGLGRSRRRQPLEAQSSAGAHGPDETGTRCNDCFVEARQPPSVLVMFTNDYTDDDVELAASGLAERGFHQLRRLNSRPPKLIVALGVDASQEQIEDVATFLSDIEHVEGVRVIYPGWSRNP